MIIKDINKLLASVDGELSAIAHGRPASSKQELIDLSYAIRSLYESKILAVFSPISEAPKDGSWILAAGDGWTHPDLRAWSEGVEQAVGDPRWVPTSVIMMPDVQAQQPTHWLEVQSNESA